MPVDELGDGLGDELGEPEPLGDGPGDPESLGDGPGDAESLGEGPADEPGYVGLGELPSGTRYTFHVLSRWATRLRGRSADDWEPRPERVASSTPGRSGCDATTGSKRSLR